MAEENKMKNAVFFQNNTSVFILKGLFFVYSDTTIDT